MTSPLPDRSSAAAMRSVRVSCQTIALQYGRPVRRFHTTVVSRWLVMPSAARSRWVRSALFSAVSITARVRSQISVGLCSTQPGLGRTCSCSSWWRAISLPPWSKIMKRVLVVPWSTAPTKSGMGVLLVLHSAKSGGGLEVLGGHAVQRGVGGQVPLVQVLVGRAADDRADDGRHD